MMLRRRRKLETGNGIVQQQPELLNNCEYQYKPPLLLLSSATSAFSSSLSTLSSLSSSCSLSALTASPTNNIKSNRMFQNHNNYKINNNSLKNNNNNNNSNSNVQRSPSPRAASCVVNCRSVAPANGPDRWQCSSAAIQSQDAAYPYRLRSLSARERPSPINNRTITSVSVLNVIIIVMLDLIKSTSIQCTAALSSKPTTTTTMSASSASIGTSSSSTAKRRTTAHFNSDLNSRTDTVPWSSGPASFTASLSPLLILLLSSLSSLLFCFGRQNDCKRTTVLGARSIVRLSLSKVCLFVILCLTLTSSYNSVNAQSPAPQLTSTTTTTASVSSSISSSSASPTQPVAAPSSSSQQQQPTSVQPEANKSTNLSDILNSNYESTTLSSSIIQSGSGNGSSLTKPEVSSLPSIGSDNVHIQRFSHTPDPLTEEQHICGSIDIRNSIEQFSKLENCTVIEGSLKIVLFDNGTVKDFENVTFPKLREITDFFLIFRIMGLQSLAKLFPNLAVIRGRELLHDYAFVVYEMLQLQEIGLVHLREIQRGDVRIEKNPNLCYVDTVDWRSIAKNALITENNSPDKCPQCPRHCPRMQNDENLSLLCWNGEQCQNLPCPDCEKLNRTCTVTGQCCPEQCIGGCYQSDPLDPFSMTCVACRNFVFENRCYEKCPEGTYELFNRRCVTKKQCNAQFITEKGNKVHYKAFDRKCESHCPVGYTENVNNPMECIFCGNACPKFCTSMSITNIAAVQTLKGCTIINGSLEIAIQGGGEQVAKELEENLKDVREITEYLKVTRSYPLISLDFLKNLQIIHGTKLERGAYALFIVDNANLQELWSFKPEDIITDPDVSENELSKSGKRRPIQVLNGRVFAHLNSKLCYNKISNLRDYMNITKAKWPWDERDVSRLSNGDRVPCDVARLNVTVWGIAPLLAGIRFDNFKSKLADRRGLLGYLIYYREAPHQNVSIFDGRDACSKDEWNVIEFDDSEPEPAVFHENSTSGPTLLNDTHVQLQSLLPQYTQILPDLKPFTRYALYVKTYMIASESKGAQSDIVYFKTKPDTPSQPRNIFSKATKHSEIFVKWEPPSAPNGEITRYIVRARKDNVLKQARDFCSESKDIATSKPRKEQPKKIVDEPFNSSHWTQGNSSSKFPFKIDPNNYSANNLTLQEYIQAGKCCACSKVDKINPAEKEQKIQFEDYIINTVYIKRQSDSGNATSDPIKSRRRREMFSSEMSTESSVSTETVTFDPASSTTSSSTSASTTEVYQFMKQVFHQLSIVIDDLEHYSEYAVSVQACQNNYDEDGPRTTAPCSMTAMTSIRTLPLPGADDIEQASISYQFDNNTEQDSKLRSVFMSWKEPSSPNGYILSYHLEYQQLISEQKQGHPTLRCISHDTYEQHNGVNLQLTPGNYSVRVRARSLADYGNWTEPIYINIDEPSKISAIFWAILFMICVPLIIALIVSLYLLKQNRAKLDYISVNPEYISAGLYYEPDPAWEIERDSIKLLKELGQGSFGMVYRGELKKDLKCIVPCAVKTVNEHASLRERIDFLKEADVMKSFTDCHHVVKLLGIVSATQPVYVLMEIMPLGDLRKYLRDNRPDNEESERPVPPPEDLLIRFAIQIADGMAYLASKKFVHRDLAARNCMINEELTVKIGDFGMTRDIYETDYYRKGGKGLLPVRWMSPESLKDGLFTTFSDVWSYGIVLWEMATLAAQPYAGLSNEEVLKFVTEGGKMTRPKDCSEVLWTLMEQTWAWKAKSRPTFLKIVDFLLAYVERDSFLPVSYYWQWRTKEKKNRAKQSGMLDSNGQIADLGLDELIPLNRLENTETQEFDDHGEEADDGPVKFFPISQPVGSNMKIFEDLKNSTSPADEKQPELSNNNDADKDTDAEVTLAKSESLSSTSTSEPGSPSSRDSGLNFVQHDESIEVDGRHNGLREDEDDGLRSNTKQILPGSYPSDASGLSRNSSVVESQNSSPRGSTNGISSGIINGHLMNTNTSFV